MSARDDLLIRRFIGALRSEVKRHVSVAPAMMLGTVTQTSPLEVLLDGSSSSAPASHLTSYTPVLHDRVAIHQFRGMLLVHGTWA